MNTEKTKHCLVDFGSLMGDGLEPMPTLVFSVFIVSLWSNQTAPIER